MSGSLPTSPEFRTIDFDSVHSVTMSNANSGRSFRRLIGGHNFSFKLKYNNSLSREQVETIFGFLQKQKNGFDTFTVNLPDKNTPRGVATGTPLVNGASQTGSSLITDGWTVSVTGIMKRGDILKLNGHSKVYMVTDDANSNASGQATINISPALIVSPADNESVIVNSVPFTVTVDGEVTGYQAVPGGLYSITVPLIEVY